MHRSVHISVCDAAAGHSAMYARTGSICVRHMSAFFVNIAVAASCYVTHLDV